MGAARGRGRGGARGRGRGAGHHNTNLPSTQASSPGSPPSQDLEIGKYYWFKKGSPGAAGPDKHFGGQVKSLESGRITWEWMDPHVRSKTAVAQQNSLDPVPTLITPVQMEQLLMDASLNQRQVDDIIITNNQAPAPGLGSSHPEIFSFAGFSDTENRGQ